MTQYIHSGMLKILDNLGVITRALILLVVAATIWIFIDRARHLIWNSATETRQQYQENHINIERRTVSDYIQSHRDDLPLQPLLTAIPNSVASLLMTEPEDNPQRDALTESWDQRVRRLIEQHLAHVDHVGGVNTIRDQQLVCLARNIYFESRGQPLAGQVGVAMVTLNRLDQNYANTICGVVRQRLVPNVCQFSWVCTHPNARAGGNAWREAVGVALAVLHSRLEIEDPTHGATHFHATYVRPSWGRQYAELQRIGDHIFYKPRDNR